MYHRIGGWICNYTCSSTSHSFIFTLGKLHCTTKVCPEREEEERATVLKEGRLKRGDGERGEMVQEGRGGG